MNTIRLGARRAIKLKLMLDRRRASWENMYGERGSELVVKICSVAENY